ncbi:MAG TPA: DUF3667 domain-containing protein [Flavobacteriaceae bacterium]|nr:DUF3667 domain-containing protein [Flavobacteriaceae bacterium]
MLCKNCQTKFLLESDFCYNCGAKVIRNRLTLKNLINDFSEQFLNYDNKFLQTFIHLFTKPESVIDGYIRGTRKRYVNIISYFAIAITITGLEYFIVRSFHPEFLDLSAISTKGTEAFTNNILKFVQDYHSIVLMLFVPLYALMSKIVFFNINKYNYTEHLVAFMYIIAQLTILGAFIVVFSALVGLKMGNISFYVMLMQITFSAYCLKRLYQLSFKGIVLRTLFFLLILLVFYVIAIIVTMVIMFATGGTEVFKEMIEAQRAAQ